MLSNGLDYITIEGFKSIDSIKKLELRPINVLIGANGAGKSNFIGAFKFLHAIGEGGLSEYVGTASGADKISSKVTNEVHLEISFGNKANQYDLRLRPNASDWLFRSMELIRNDEVYAGVPFLLPPQNSGFEAGISDPFIQGLGKRIREFLGSWRFCHLNDTSSSSPIQKTNQVDDNRFLRSNGSNLAAFLYFLRIKHENSYRQIQWTVRRVAPFFEDFELEPRHLGPDTIRLQWRHKNSDQYFDTYSMSDGTLRFIALATLFLQPESLRPSIILVDEPEMGLHPYAIELLAALIKQASVSTQVIVSTQSSLLLDHFDPADVLVANRVNHSTQISRLDPARLAVWLEDYSLGQLWEKNELEGQPVPE